MCFCRVGFKGMSKGTAGVWGLKRDCLGIGTALVMCCVFQIGWVGTDMACAACYTHPARILKTGMGIGACIRARGFEFGPGQISTQILDFVVELI